jgi:exopolysaccharide biosynthesis WecB/TagA/CpsF family protein
MKIMNVKNNIQNKIKKNEFGKKVILNFLNSDCTYNYVKQPIFKKSLLNKKTNQINFIDGFINSLILSLKNFKRIFRTRGPRFTKLFLHNRKINENKRHFFIGLDENKKKLLIKNSILEEKDVFDYNPPYIKQNKFSEKEINKIVQKINESKTDYVWVCIGSPKQNILATDIYQKIKLNKFIIFNVGAALDFLIKTKKESPRIIQEVGLEWLYRFITDFKYSRKKVWRSLLGSGYGLFVVELKK